MDKILIKYIVILGIICLLIGGVIGYFMGSVPASECLTSPLNYGMEKLRGGDLIITCYCSFNNPNYAPFFFNKTGVFNYG